MSEKLFADTLFVGYGKDVPREERIPCTEDLPLVAEIITCFARTGQPLEGCL